MMVFLEIINKTGLVLNVNVFLTIISETIVKCHQFIYLIMKYSLYKCLIH